MTEPRDAARATAPLVTVYIPCHNYGRFLSRAIDSVLQQLYDTWELIIIDDGSTDETTEVALSYVRADPERLSFVRNDHPQGLPAAANAAIARARGEFLLRLDADDWLDEGALLVLVGRATKDDRPAIVYGGFHTVAASGELLGVRWQRPAWDRGGGGGVQPPHGACSLVDLRALKSIGGYAEDIDAQDGWDLWYRMSGGLISATVTTPVFYYRQHPASLSRDDERLRAARSRILRNVRSVRTGDYAPSVLAVIPAKESYAGLAGVPYTDIGGRTLLEYAITAAQSSPVVSDVLVISDSHDVLAHSQTLETDARVAQHYRAHRSADLDTSFVPLSALLRHAAASYREQSGRRPDVLVFLSLHVATRSADDITAVVDALFVMRTDVSVTVTRERDPVFVYSADGLRLIGNGRLDEVRPFADEIYRFDNVALACWTEEAENDRIWNGRIGFVDMSSAKHVRLEDRPSLDVVRSTHDGSSA